LRKFVKGGVVSDKDLPPYESWLTDEELISRSSNELTLVNESNIDGGDGGQSFFMRKLSASLYIGDPSFDQQFSLLSQAASRQTSSGQGSASVVSGFCTYFAGVRAQISSIYNTFASSTDATAKSSAFQSARSFAVNFVENFNSLSKRKRTVLVEFFSIERKVGMTWTSISSGASDLNSAIKAVSLLETSKVQDAKTYVEDVRRRTVKQTERALSLDSNKSLALFAPLVFNDKSLDRQRFDDITNGLSRNSDFEFLTVEETDAGVHEISPAEHELPVEVSEEEVSDLSSSGTDSYVQKAIHLGLHLQVFKVGQNVRILNPTHKNHEMVYSVKSVRTDKGAVSKQNPRGTLIDLSENAGTWEPKDLTSSIPFVEQEVVPASPEIATKEPLSKSPVSAKPVPAPLPEAKSPLSSEKPDAFDDIDLDLGSKASRKGEIKTSTDYFYSYLKSNWDRRSQTSDLKGSWPDKDYSSKNPGAGDVDAAMLGANWADIAKAFKNKSTMRDQVGGYPIVSDDSSYYQVVTFSERGVH
jgi:hypothetical protein